MFLAKSSDESVNLTEAQRFLKATRFNASKAIDVFKNYHVSDYFHEQASKQCIRGQFVAVS